MLCVHLSAAQFNFENFLHKNTAQMRFSVPWSTRSLFILQISTINAFVENGEYSLSCRCNDLGATTTIGRSRTRTAHERCVCETCAVDTCIIVHARENVTRAICNNWDSPESRVPGCFERKSHGGNVIVKGRFRPFSGVENPTKHTFHWQRGWPRLPLYQNSCCTS